MMEIKNIREVLKQGAQFLEDNLKDGIINQNLLKSGGLGRSVNVTYNDDDKEPSYTISMEDYGYYQDSGVKGTKGWRYTPNQQSYFEPGQFRSKVIGGTLPFAVRKSIAEKGFRPRPFIQPSVDRTIQNLEKPLTEAGVDDINIEVYELFTKNGAIVK